MKTLPKNFLVLAHKEPKYNYALLVKLYFEYKITSKLTSDPKQFFDLINNDNLFCFVVEDGSITILTGQRSNLFLESKYDKFTTQQFGLNIDDLDISFSSRKAVNQNLIDSVVKKLKNVDLSLLNNDILKDIQILEQRIDSIS